MLIGRCVFRAFRPRTTSQTEKVTSSDRSREPALSEVERGPALYLTSDNIHGNPPPSPLSSRLPRPAVGAEPRDPQFHLISNEPQGSPQPHPQLVSKIVEILNH